ncbi:GPW/gp25 family protein [Fibrivirga algicola]|uniref:GPW/gp25 family protein n=1 Tax=Fibrivirga algicola TaxID=2950420 RepID=A0ABX0QHW2_9BACT|nr:GPW/gp25 family protein [Fibrivirga algicola]ARK12356.1 hypothetical protein A6C57_19570 [Fibrella sp. ES10-3-2-2]NID10800.1 GPW/gp25 family protein [Fibrivirga algicola]
MSHVYYRYPIRLNSLMTGADLPTCDIGASIAQFLNMLLHSRFNELRSDPSFGCSIWDTEFDHTMNQYTWESQLTLSLTEAVKQQEPRLRDVSVRVIIQSAAGIDGLPGNTRRLADVSVSATVQMTNEPFRFTTRLLLGTLSGR